jgi:hypothetical protein
MHGSRKQLGTHLADGAQSTSNCLTDALGRQNCHKWAAGYRRGLYQAMRRCLVTKTPFLPQGLGGRIAAAVWVLACISLLINELHFRNASPHSFGDAEEMEELLMMCLSAPAGLIGLLPASGLHISLPENDVRQIVLGWLFPFVLGYVQWFMVVPFVARRLLRR